MSCKQCIAALGKWQGFRIGSVERKCIAPDAVEEHWIELFPEPGSPMECVECGDVMDKHYDCRERWVQDLPAWGAVTMLLVHLRRGICSRCGVRTERVAWLSPYARVTKRLAHSVAQLCEVMTIRHVARYFGLLWDTVKRIHKAYLIKALGEADLREVEVIAMDEFALRKGHRYATVIADARTQRVLWVGHGRSQEAIRPFFELLGAQGRNRIKAAVMDMWKPYEAEFRAQCPQGEIVYDRFHLLSKFGRDVVDRVRADEVKLLEGDERKVIKGSKWLLLRNKENLQNNGQRIRLKELLTLNKRLAAVYILKEDLKHLWAYKYMGAAIRFWEQWRNQAMRSRIKPLKDFARKLDKKFQGILAHCLFPFNTGFLEGMNNKIKVMKRMAYGFRDDEYFFLKIRYAFRGVST